ncbi:tyrosine-type recombinase/integrase [Halobaculum sp. P14]|uniref:tyrosine-type recombinase/integrase n=1 Tax=Halobaculum sp. P14 TaxID=3421638 RepID=UPI003EBBF891
MNNPDEVSPREAADRWLSKRGVDCSDTTIATYWYRIKKIVDFCEERDIDRLSELTPWALDEFDSEMRGRGPEKVTLSKEYRTMNKWLEWAENIGIARESISEVLDPPETTKEEEVNRDRLEPAIAKSTIRAFRSQPVGADRATLPHTILELLWWTGARMGAIRGIDRSDIDLEEGTIEFYHRPETETPIKPAHNPERKIGIPDHVVDVIQDYVDEVRYDVFDDHQRRPLLTTQNGRISSSTFRRYSYVASLPCQSLPCPHDKDPSRCDWAQRRGASKCPSSRGPHAIRTGAISNLLNSGWTLDDVADRVNTGQKRLLDHYDFPTMDEQYRERRADLVDLLSLDNISDTYQNDDH